MTYRVTPQNAATLTSLAGIRFRGRVAGRDEVPRG